MRNHYEPEYLHHNCVQSVVNKPNFNTEEFPYS
jgi:hypothetical protein